MQYIGIGVFQPAYPSSSRKPWRFNIWTSILDANTGHYYFYNAATGESSWTQPEEYQKAGANQWERRMSTVGDPYFVPADGAESASAESSPALPPSDESDAWEQRFDPASGHAYY